MMKTPTKVLFLALVLSVLVSGCYYQTETTEDNADGEQVSYIGEETGDVSEVLDESEASDAETEELAEEEDIEAELATEEETAEEARPASSASEITAYEGELVQLKVKGNDPDGDPITYTFSEPLDADGKWQTNTGDAGEYLVTVTASDGKTQTERTLKIRVLSKNAPPAMEKIADVTVREGETVSFSPKVLDPDGDEIAVTYSGWMTSSSKTTGFGDQGTYTVTITASDGEQEVSQNVRVTVTDVNRAPEFEIIVS